MATAQQIIQDYSQAYGIPSYIPLTIADQESSFNPDVNVIDTNGVYSTGLFQLNQNGLGAGHSTTDLKNPELNTQIALTHMMPTYESGVAQGLEGFPLVEYVANNSGWPGSMGVSWTESNTNYDQGLQRKYAEVTGGANVVGPPIPGTSEWTQAQASQEAATNPSGGFITQIAKMENMQSYSDWATQNKRGGSMDYSAPLAYMVDQSGHVGFRLLLVLVGLLLVIFGLVVIVKRSGVVPVPV